MGRGSLKRAASLLRQVSTRGSGSIITAAETGTSAVPIFDVRRSLTVGASLARLAGQQHGATQMESQSTTVCSSMCSRSTHDRATTAYYVASSSFGVRTIATAALQPSDVYVGECLLWLLPRRHGNVLMKQYHTHGHIDVASQVCAPAQQCHPSRGGRDARHSGVPDHGRPH